MEYGSGTEYLTQIEIDNNVMACQRNGAQAMSMSMTSIKEFKMQYQNREPNSQELWASAKREGLDGPRGAQITGRGKVPDPEPVIIEVEPAKTFDKEGEGDDKKAAGKDVAEEKNDNCECSYMAKALVISGGLVADDASVIGVYDDVAIPLLIGGAYVLDKITGTNEKHTSPAPKLTKTYQPVSENPIHNPTGGINPDNPSGNNWVKWMLRGVGAYQAYDAYQENFKDTNVGPTFNLTKIDRTYVAPRLR